MPRQRGQNVQSMSDLMDMDIDNANPRCRSGRSLFSVSMMPEANIKTYASGTVFIFDHLSMEAVEASQNASLPDHFHAQCCNRIDNFFSDYTRYNVQRVNLASYDERRFLKWWKAVLASKSSDELVIVYYQGKAVGHRKDFTLHFRSSPKSLNVYELIQITNDSTVDCLFIFDCPFLTRQRRAKGDKEAKLPQRARRHTEYIIAGQQKSERKSYETQDLSGFTFQFSRWYKKFVKRIDSSFLGVRKRMTLPGLLARNPYLASNPLRIWNTCPSMNKDKLVYRFVVDPNHVRHTGQLEIFRVRLRYPEFGEGNGEDEDDEIESGGDDSDDAGDDGDGDGDDGDDDGDDGDDEDDGEDDDHVSAASSREDRHEHIDNEDCAVCSGRVNDLDEADSSPSDSESGSLFIAQPNTNTEFYRRARDSYLSSQSQIHESQNVESQGTQSQDVQNQDVEAQLAQLQSVLDLNDESQDVVEVPAWPQPPPVFVDLTIDSDPDDVMIVDSAASAAAWEVASASRIKSEKPDQPVKVEYIDID